MVHDIIDKEPYLQFAKECTPINFKKKIGRYTLIGLW